MNGTKPAAAARVACAVSMLAATMALPASSSALGKPAPSLGAKQCAALAGLARDDLLIGKAEIVPAGPAPAPPGAQAAQLLPEHCLVRGTINPRVGFGGREFGIGFELRLPTDWNGRFLFQGGGGLDGQVLPALGMIANSDRDPALVRGFAVVSTDSGHSGSMVDPSFGVDQQARTDYGYNALDKVTHEAKLILARFYGAGPRYSYFMGCSNGGRQAMMASQRLPLQFDGIVAGDPAMRFSRIGLSEAWNMQILSRIAPKDADGNPIYARAFADSDLQLVKRAVLARCDKLDGLEDGLINNWQSCDFDPAQLTCKPGEADDCLSSAKVGALHDLFEGPRTAGGQHIYGPFTFDTGIASPAWRGMRLGTSQTGQPNSADSTLGLGMFRLFQLTPPDPHWDPLLPFDNDAMLDRVRYSAALADADSPMLSTFALKGKLIVYNGMSDQGMATSTMVDWYGKMLDATGEPGRNAVRLFTIPGMTHCGGGEATDRFEMLDAITDWVERGKAPERIIASGKAMPGLSRPLCPFPKWARYTGGNPSSAASFECTE